MRGKRVCREQNRRSNQEAEGKQRHSAQIIVILWKAYNCEERYICQGRRKQKEKQKEMMVLC